MNNEFVMVPRATVSQLSYGVLEAASLSIRDELRALLSQPVAQCQGEPVDRIQTINLLNEALQSGGDWVFYVRPLIIKARDLLESKP